MKDTETSLPPVTEKPQAEKLDERSVLNEQICSYHRHPECAGQDRAVRPGGIGKSTFASYFPDPVFIDTEGGTKRLNVKRLPQPTSWAMLLDEVAEVRKGSVPCGTLVIDTADWAERLCIQAVCAKPR